MQHTNCILLTILGLALGSLWVASSCAQEVRPRLEPAFAFKGQIEQVRVELRWKSVSGPTAYDSRRGSIFPASD